jgi:hypothetical protein
VSGFQAFDCHLDELLTHVDGCAGNGIAHGAHDTAGSGQGANRELRVQHAR